MSNHWARGSSLSAVSSHTVSPASSNASSNCDLCGLPLATGKVSLESANEDSELRFCCRGCRMVYSMLMTASDAGDPAGFRETDLFKRCQAAGIIPASEEDLQRLAESQESGVDPYQSPDQPGTPDKPLLTLNLTVAGMWCPACAWVIEESLRQTGGVFNLRCNFAVDRLQCTYDPTRTSPSQIRLKIEALGYGVDESDTTRRSSRQRSELIRLLITAFLGMNVMMLSFALYSGFFVELTPDAIRSISWPIFLMATATVSYGGWPIFRKALAGIKAKAPGMEALIAMGSLSAYGYSLYNFFNRSIHLYFDTAGMLIVLTLLGKMIEEQAKKGVRGTLDSLFALAPKKVRLITPEFQQGRFVDIALLKNGDQFRVDADEIAAADGIALSGQAQADESALTGEARPVSIAAGSPVKSGARLISGSVIVSATAVGPESMLGQMAAVIQESIYRNSPLESRSDRILRSFVPAILLLAAGTGVACLWVGLPIETAVTRMVTVMVIACPCALGIAIPMARVAGIGLAGRNGILVREFEAFEQADRIDTVVFDKTGTLTTGKWRLTDIHDCRGCGELFILGLAAGLEKESEHVVAEEIRRNLSQKGVEALDVENRVIHSNGVLGDYQGRTYRLGSRRFVLKEKKTDLNRQIRAVDATVEISRVFLCTDDLLVAVLCFGDALRPSAAETVRNLVNRNLRVSLVTGDENASAQKVARQLVIPELHADMLPLEKAAYVDRLRQVGRKTAMLGDGVNDAPALSRADLSAAIATVNPLMDQAAQITLMRADPYQLVEFIELARKVNRKIHQNLWCALIYNLISIPIAMAGWISPLVAVTAMLASSLTVILNTLLLARVDPHKEMK